MMAAHIGAAKISARGKDFYFQGEGLQKMTKEGELFLKLRVWLGRG